jgi:hypothetical protein
VTNNEHYHRIHNDDRKVQFLYAREKGSDIQGRVLKKALVQIEDFLKVTLRSWHKARRCDVGASEAGEIASRDPTNKARLYEVGGLTLYSCDKIIN